MTARPASIVATFALALALAAGVRPAAAAEDFSVAERALFITNHLAQVKPPATLTYQYRRRGSLEQAFDDAVSVALAAQDDGRCCRASAQFLSGTRRLALPEVDSAQGNPVILYFLERDIREMQRLTKGQANYFRKRIRMAVYQGATVRDVTLPWRGGTVAGREFTISPYRDDPLRARFETLADKQYVFTLSDAVPGGVYTLRTQVAGTTAGVEPLIVEELRADGATPSGPNPAPRTP